MFWNFPLELSEVGRITKPLTGESKSFVEKAYQDVEKNLSFLTVFYYIIFKNL